MKNTRKIFRRQSIKKQFIILGVLFFNAAVPKCQSSYTDLLNMGIKIPGHFIYKEPIKSISLSRQDIIDYCCYGITENSTPVDTTILFEMIDNNKSADTAIWTDTEINNYYLLENGYINPYKFIDEKLKQTDLLSREYFFEQIETINNPDNCAKGICKVSRPLFDKSQDYAIMQFQYTNCRNEGYFVIKLFRKVNQVWQKGLIIKEWRTSLVY